MPLSLDGRLRSTVRTVPEHSSPQWSNRVNHDSIGRMLDASPDELIKRQRGLPEIRSAKRTPRS